MNLFGWLTGPKLPKVPWDRAGDISDLLYMAGIPETGDSIRRAGELRDAAWGTWDRHLKVTRGIVETLRREFS
jgi:hypothetical protein